MAIFLLYPQAGDGDTHGVAHPVFAGCLSGLLELALHLCRANFPQKALGLLCGHSCLLCSLGRQEEHAAVSALWEWEKRLFLSLSALKLSWEDLCKQQVTYPSQDKLSTFPSVLR